MQKGTERRAAVITELRELVAECDTGRARTSVGIPATSYTAEEYAALVAAARTDQSQSGSDFRRLRWWVFLSLAAETHLGVRDLLAMTWTDLHSLPMSPAVRNEVLTPEHLASLRTSTWLEATTFAREVDHHPFPWSSSVVLRKLKRLCATTGVAYRG